MASKEGAEVVHRLGCIGIQCIWKDVDSTQLDEEDVFDMVSALIPLLTKWKEIGTALGLRHSALEIIEATNKGGARMCMQGMLVQYVRKSYNCDRFGDPSWMCLCKAIAHPAGGNNEELAQTISKEHPTKVIQAPQSKKTLANAVKHVPQSKPAQDDHPYSIGCPVHLLQYDWYHGKLSQEEANKLLTAVGGPCFLVREERRKHGTLVLSVMGERGINHFPINRGPGWYEVIGTARKFDTVGDFVTYYKTNGLSGYSQLMLGSSCARKIEPVSDSLYSGVARENPYQRGKPGDLLQHSWYYGEMSKRLAEKKLSELEDSLFLIWVESSELYLSLKLTDRMSHFKIERGPGWYTVQDTFQLFPSVPDLVSYYNLEQLPAASNVVNYYNLNGEFHSAVQGLQHIYDYIEVKTTSMHVYETIPAGRRDKTLLEACKRGDARSVCILLEGGADPNMVDQYNITALYWASHNGNEEIVNILLQYKAIVNSQHKNGWTALYVASEKGHERIVEALINARANVDLQITGGSTALWTASFDGHEQIVQRLVNAGAAVDTQKKDGATALYAAGQNNHDNVVSILVDAKANFDLQMKTGATALYVASQNNHDNVVSILVAAKANLNLQDNDGQTALYSASFNGHVKIVTQLIDAGATVDTQAKDGATALHAACQEGHLRVAEYLINAKADLNLLTNDGRTALWIASFYGHEQIVHRLVNVGTTINTQEKDGFTALHVACQNGHSRVAECLLDAKADLNLLTNYNSTPLMWAAHEGHGSIVRLLLSRGADTTIRNKDGDTAYDQAKKNGHNDVCKLLSGEQSCSVM